MFEKFEEGLDAFCKGSSIDEVRSFWGFGRNKTIKILKSSLGEEKYSKIAKETAISRFRVAGNNANTGTKRGPMPKERREKISKGNTGKKLSHETRQKISSSLKERNSKLGPARSRESYLLGAAKSRETKIKKGIYERHARLMTGRKYSMPESGKEKIRISRAKFFENGGQTFMKGKSLNNKTRAKISEQISLLWQNGRYSGKGLWRSRLEKNVIEYLQNSHECVHSYRIKNRVFDIFVPDLNLLVEVNGDYWHLNPAMYCPDFFDRHRCIYAQDIWIRDGLKAKLASESGYNFVTLWQRDLCQDFEGAIINAIKKFKGGDRQEEACASN